MERTDRTPITDIALDCAIENLRHKIQHAFNKHGRGEFSNRFETLGVLQLEFDEFKKAIQDREGDDREVDELLDIATVAIVAVAGFLNG
jgi:hypothetical protein